MGALKLTYSENLEVKNCSHLRVAYNFFGSNFSEKEVLSSNPLSFIDPDGGYDGQALNEGAFNDQDWRMLNEGTDLYEFERLQVICPDCSGSQLLRIKSAMKNGSADLVMDQINWEISRENGTIIRDQRIMAYTDHKLDDGSGYRPSGTLYTVTEYHYRATNYFKIRMFESDLNVFGKSAGYLSGVFGLAQIGLIEYRKGLDINAKVNSSSRFMTTYRGLGVTTRFTGYLGNVGTGAVFISDLNSVSTGELSPERFTFRTTGLAASIATGTAIGGAPGAVGGAVVGAIWMGAEYTYDIVVKPIMKEVSRVIGNVEIQLSNGWRPSR